MKEKKPTNISVAVYLANNHRDHIKSDDDFKKVAALYNLKWRVLKRNYEAIVGINDLFEEDEV